jgi:hypothetical protein
MPRKNLEEKTPKGGWLGPPGVGHIPPSHVAVGSKKGTGFSWKLSPLTAKQEKKRKKFFKRMKQADNEGKWSWD